MFTEMCDDFIRKIFPTMYAGTLDGRKGIVFAHLLTDYVEWCRRRGVSRRRSVQREY